MRGAAASYTSLMLLPRGDAWTKFHCNATVQHRAAMCLDHPAAQCNVPPAFFVEQPCAAPPGAAACKQVTAAAARGLAVVAAALAARQRQPPAARRRVTAAAAAAGSAILIMDTLNMISLGIIRLML